MGITGTIVRQRHVRIKDILFRYYYFIIKMDIQFNYLRTQAHDRLEYYFIYEMYKKVLGKSFDHLIHFHWTLLGSG
jgi:hypothetical protein